MNKELTPLEAFRLFCKELKIENSEFAETIATALKALEIIKEKKVNLEYLKCCETYEQYKTICSYWNEINNEQFDLLKEYFK